MNKYSGDTTHPVGIVAMQGGYSLHAEKLTALKAKWLYIKNAAEIQNCRALIIPGGESTTMLKFILENGIADEIVTFAKTGKKIFATCAGTILLANEVLNPAQQSLGLIDITVERNSFGRQLSSRICQGKNHLTNNFEEMVFIRAPKITRIGKNVEVLASLDDEPVCVREKNIVVATFHPELSNNLFWHKLLIE
jgi:pyridoxal 5'-phosphate synthase pdxT subunit